MISASTLNSELINKIAQDFAQATSLAVVVVNIHGDEISELFNFTPFCQLMRQHPQHSTRCRMSDRCGGLEAAVTVKASEIVCADPACPGIETVILILAPGRPTRALKVPRSLPEVTEADILAAFAGEGGVPAG